MNKVVRSTNYSVEQWLVVDDTGNQTGSFSCWQDANNYAIQLNSKGIKSTNGTDIIASNGTTTNKNSMKTINDAALEYAELKANKLFRRLEVSIAEKSFKAGVEFAQRWIPIEEDLPEKFKQVIVKLENGWHTCTWIMEDGTFAFNVKPTHWRHIDLK